MLSVRQRKDRKRLLGLRSIARERDCVPITRCINGGKKKDVTRKTNLVLVRLRGSG